MASQQDLIDLCDRCEDAIDKINVYLERNPGFELRGNLEKIKNDYFGFIRKYQDKIIDKVLEEIGPPAKNIREASDELKTAIRNLEIVDGVLNQLADAIGFIGNLAGRLI